VTGATETDNNFRRPFRSCRPATGAVAGAMLPPAELLGDSVAMAYRFFRARCGCLLHKAWIRALRDLVGPQGRTYTYEHVSKTPGNRMITGVYQPASDNDAT
jgi:hypothetical protein